jgi:asparagine synthase (glutamine-hydrolysing)
LLQCSGLDRLDDLPPTDLPSTDVVIAAQDKLIFELISACSRHHMTGGGGDALFDAARTSFADMFMAGQKREALWQAASWARRNQASPLRTGRALVQLAGTSRDQSMRSVANQLRAQYLPRKRGSELWEGLAWCTTTPAAHWLTSTAAKSVADILLSPERTLYEGAGPGATQDWQSIHGTNRNSASASAIARKVGVTIHTPYYDSAVMRACLSLAGYERSSVTQFKPLAKAAFRDILPEALLGRTTKGSYSGSIYRGFRKNAVHLARMVEESRLIGAGVFKGEAVRNRLEGILAGAEALDPSFDAFIAAEIWLKKLDLDRRTWWEEV